MIIADFPVFFKSKSEKGNRKPLMNRLIANNKLKLSYLGLQVKITKMTSQRGSIRNRDKAGIVPLDVVLRYSCPILPSYHFRHAKTGSSIRFVTSNKRGLYMPMTLTLFI